MTTDVEVERAMETKSRQGKPPRYALVFRTHFWDDFAQRQFDRAKLRAKSGDVFVLVDETRGKIPNIGAERVFGLTDGEILEAGFVGGVEGSIQWYSGDVPLYLFYAKHSSYDYYIQMEYDVNIHVDIDQLVERLETDQVDVLGLTNAEPINQWHWLSTCVEAYGLNGVRHQLLCLSAFSNNALSKLYEKRIEQAALFKSGILNEWPYCEGFVPSEAARQGLKFAELSHYGNVDAYQWWPPYLESDLKHLQRNAFVHPVLDPDRYIPSLFKRPEGLRWLLSPTNRLHRKLRRLGVRRYVRTLLGKQFIGELRAALARRKDQRGDS